MKKIAILFLLITTSCLAQLDLRSNPYLKGEIILLNGEIKNGFIKLDGSAFSIKFKENEDQKNSDKIDYKNIDKIIINPNLSSRREFYYKKTDADKFNKFVELIYSNNLDVYIYSTDNLSLFYSGVDRSNVSDFLNGMGSPIVNGNNVIWTGHTSISKIKENLAKAKNIKYLLHKKDSEKLNFIYSNKNLKEFAMENFKDCPDLILKIENKDLILDDIVEIVDLYNKCISGE